MKEELLFQEQRAQEVRRLKMRSVRGIALVCLACLCMFSSIPLRLAMLVSPPAWSEVILLVSTALLLPLVLDLLGDISKMQNHLKRLH
ncbi:MAG: hypothetical protein IPK84_02645 [Candidatus Moraniibacteriota bacterium]|nr:MAG: hypothetical protein IPK84_02645 [Candidatus Moranbacteria bacterium]